MDKVKIGIPRALHYYYYGNMWISFLEELGYEIIMSPKTNKEILDLGCKIAQDEMCLSLKIYLGHIKSLESKCEYILVPRIDNYGIYEQTCTNFLGLYDIVSNLCTTKLLTYNISKTHHLGEMDAFIKLGMLLGKGKEQSKIAYFHSAKKLQKERKIKNSLETEKLKSRALKVLIISHPYNLYDSYIGSPILKILKELRVEAIYADAFIGNQSKIKAEEISKELYWKYSKELIGTISLLEHQVDGILFFTSFPCALDSLVNELLFRKVKIPYLNLVLDEESGSAGMETRLESFVDILEQKRKKVR